MAFNRKKKSLVEVLTTYKLRYEEEVFFIKTDFPLPDTINEELDFVLEHLDYKCSESAIREYVISPFLKAAWREYAEDFLLWVEKEIRFDETLNGVPDYVISRKSTMGKIFFESPHVAVIEAKKDDFIGGWAQCALEMYAIHKINNADNATVFGIVTNGDTWEIASLENGNFVKYKNSFSLNNKKELYNALCSLLAQCKIQFQNIS